MYFINFGSNTDSGGAGTYAAISGNHAYYCTGARDEADSVNPAGIDTEYGLHGVALD